MHYAARNGSERRPNQCDGDDSAAVEGFLTVSQRGPFAHPGRAAISYLAHGLVVGRSVWGSSSLFSDDEERVLVVKWGAGNLQ